MVALSVNVNKIATLRNARGGTIPDLAAGVRVCVEAGAAGITVHPRADERHITRSDALAVGRWLEEHAPEVEYNIEGDPRPDWVALVESIAPTQATLVPVRPGEVTSEAGWRTSSTNDAALAKVVQRLRACGTRVSLFVDPDPEAVAWAAGVGAERVELFTEPYARGYPRDREAAMAPYRVAAEAALAAGLGINAGHDLNLDNLAYFAALPHLAEVSIGHALVAEALFVGLAQAVRAYLRCLS